MVGDSSPDFLLAGRDWQLILDGNAHSGNFRSPKVKMLGAGNLVPAADDREP